MCLDPRVNSLGVGIPDSPIPFESGDDLASRQSFAGIVGIEILVFRDDIRQRFGNEGEIVAFLQFIGPISSGIISKRVFSPRSHDVLSNVG